VLLTGKLFLEISCISLMLNRNAAVDGHAAELAAPEVVTRLGEAVLTAQLLDR